MGLNREEWKWTWRLWYSLWMSLLWLHCKAPESREGTRALEPAALRYSSFTGKVSLLLNREVSTSLWFKQGTRTRLTRTLQSKCSLCLCFRVTWFVKAAIEGLWTLDWSRRRAAPVILQPNACTKGSEGAQLDLEILHIAAVRQKHSCFCT